jgi:murein DD-endopeptidase MepM/ murein hydrolase activator NlpD
MTAGIIRAMTIVLAAAGLTGCIDARSQYAPYAGYTPPPPNQPMRPQYAPKAAPEPAQAAAAPAAPDPEGPAPRAAPSAGVQAQGLPPVADAPPRRTASRYAASRYDAFGFGSERSSLLVPLVWRSDEAQPQWIDVARHHRMRPEIDAAPSHHRRGRHAKDDQAAASQAAQTVEVKKGDTINSIARRLHTTPKALMDANPDRRPRDLKPGDQLKLPGGDETAPKAERGRRGRAADTGGKARGGEAKSYTVKHGDTLYSIARRNGVTVDELKDLNRLQSASRLHTGQKLNLPGAPEEAAPPEERPARTPKPAASRHPAPPSREAPEAGSAFTQPGVTLPPEPAPPPPAPTPAAGAAGPSQPIPYTSLPGAHAAPPPPVAPAPAYAPPPYAPPVAAPAPGAPVTEAPAGPTDAQVAAAGRGRFVWPIPGTVLSGFGPKPGGQRNDGLDIAAPDGAPVRAAATGDVVYAGNLVPGFGNLVLIKHEDGWVTAYAHLGRTEVKIKDHVTQGAEIGTAGSSGGVDQPQLHFEVRYAPSPRERARPIDPALVLPAQ